MREQGSECRVAHDEVRTSQEGEDGYRFVERLPSHHVILATDLTRRLDVIAPVLDLAVEQI